MDYPYPFRGLVLHSIEALLCLNQQGDARIIEFVVASMKQEVETTFRPIGEVGVPAVVSLELELFFGGKRKRDRACKTSL